VRWVRGLGFGRQAGEVWIRGRGRCMRAPRGVCRRSDRAVAESGPDTTSPVHPIDRSIPTLDGCARSGARSRHGIKLSPLDRSNQIKPARLRTSLNF
jgi:hypothetical protein